MDPLLSEKLSYGVQAYALIVFPIEEQIKLNKFYLPLLPEHNPLILLILFDLPQHLFKSQYSMKMTFKKTPPIHSTQERLRRTLLSEQVQRNSSYFSNNKLRATVTAAAQSSNFAPNKPETAIITVRPHNTAPTSFITNPPAVHRQSFPHNKSGTVMRMSQCRRKKSSYLSKRFIHKKILDNCLDNVFLKVSLIRASQEKSISAIRKREHYSTTR